MFFEPLPWLWSQAMALPSHLKSSHGTNYMTFIFFRTSLGNMLNIIDSIMLPGNKEVTLYACNMQVIVPVSVPAQPSLTSIARGIILKKINNVPPTLGKFNFKNIRASNTLPFKKHSVSFNSRKNLWQHSMLWLLLILLWRWLLDLNLNQQFHSYFWNSQILLRWGPMKCSP